MNFGSKPYKDAHYIINVSNQPYLFCKICESSIATANGFHIVCYTNAATPGNATFHASVIAYVNIILFKNIILISL